MAPNRTRLTAPPHILIKDGYMKASKSRNSSSTKSSRRNRKVIGPLTVTLVAIMIVGGSVVLFAGPSLGLSFSGAWEGELRQYWEDQDFQPLIDGAIRVLEEDPQMGVAHLYAGIGSYFRAQQLGDSEVIDQLILNSIYHLNNAIFYIPQHQSRWQMEAILGMAQAHRGLLYYDVASDHLERALSLGSNEPFIHRRLAQIYLDQELYDAATERYELLIDIDDEPRDRIALIDLYLTQGDTIGARTVVQQTRTLNLNGSESNEVFILEARSYMIDGDYQRAEATLLKLLELNPLSADGLGYLGEVYAQQGDVAKARASWREALSIKPDHYYSLERLQNG